MNKCAALSVLALISAIAMATAYAPMATGGYGGYYSYVPMHYGGGGGGGGAGFGMGGGAGGSLFSSKEHKHIYYCPASQE